MRNDGRIWTFVALAATAGLAGFTSGSRGIVRRGRVEKLRDDLYYLQTYVLTKGGKKAEAGFVDKGQLTPATSRQLGSLDEQKKHRTLLNWEEMTDRTADYEFLSKEDFFRLSPEIRGILNLGLAVRSWGTVDPVDSSPLLWRSFWQSLGEPEDDLRVQYIYELSPVTMGQRALFSVCVRGPEKQIAKLLQEELERA